MAEGLTSISLYSLIPRRLKAETKNTQHLEPHAQASSKPSIRFGVWPPDSRQMTSVEGWIRFLIGQGIATIHIYAGTPGSPGGAQELSGL